MAAAGEDTLEARGGEEGRAGAGPLAAGAGSAEGEEGAEGGGEEGGKTSTEL